MNDTTIHTQVASLTSLALQAMSEGNFELAASLQEQSRELTANSES